MRKQKVTVQVASVQHFGFAHTIVGMMFDAAQKRGTGIARRTPGFIMMKMAEGHAIIATDGKTVAGFCYINAWENGAYVANSGLIVNEEFRGQGIAWRVKQAAFILSRRKYPKAKLIGLTTSEAVMRINTRLGYRAVTFSNLPQEEKFWVGCQNCVNHDILERTGRKHCLCTGMLFTPVKKEQVKKKKIALLRMKH